MENLHESQPSDFEALLREVATLRNQETESTRRLKELEFIINQSPVVVFLWRAAEGWPVEYVSDNIRQFGYTPEDFYSGRVPYATIIHPDDLSTVGRQVEKFTGEGCSHFTQEYRILTSTGEVRWTDDRTWIRRDADGRPTHYQGIVLDATERKAAELALKQSREEMEKQVVARTAELHEKVLEQQRLQQAVIEAQQQALKELATPIIPLLDGIIVMPLIGGIDTLRARDITRALLQGISQYRARVVILDITGVSRIDSDIAAYFNKTIQAARLKGCRTIITGVSDAVAETIVDLGIDWGRVESQQDLQSGLIAALSSQGMRLVTK